MATLKLKFGVTYSGQEEGDTTSDTHSTAGWHRERIIVKQFLSFRFSVSHILSDPDADWTGPRGHVNISLLQDFLPKIVAESKHLCDYFICVCGPIAFTNLSQK